jgi:putative acetyltransferase
MITIREESPADFPAVREVNERAFGRPAEARLVDMLRAANKAVLSLVATLDGRVVGHILFSPISVSVAPPDFCGVGLAPMSVLPEFQNRGIGSSLVREGLATCKRRGYDAVVVLGHVRYYPRFGFSRAVDYGLDSEYDAPESFMVVELKEGALKKVSGLVKYASKFQDIGC